MAIVDVPRSDIIIRAHAAGKAVLARARESIRWHCKLCGKIFAEMVVRIVAGRVAHERARLYALGSVEARPRRALIDVDIAKAGLRRVRFTIRYEANVCIERVEVIVAHAIRKSRDARTSKCVKRNFRYCGRLRANRAVEL